MSLKAQTHFNTICNFWGITPHGATKQFGMLTFVDEMTSAPLPGHLTPLPCLLSHLNLLLHPRLILPTLSMLTCPHRSPDETPTLPPISNLTTPYAFTLPPLPSLCLRSALPTWLQRCIPCLCSRGALPTSLRHSLPSSRSHSALLTWLRHRVPSLRSCGALPTCLLRHLPSPSLHIRSIWYSGLLAYTINAIKEIC
ncbi:hypothetical protein O181_105449 [Austropuccinia psidii MF-1]|uniref:Uncharacterized protein n=1 Tax=Austropuccinia psidii MF-1 TaxID=1389203 RepID=A0A9Q3JQ64_9BASI|nr:hypothetical protein [Austropuccinia psidii MF-1]